MSAYRLLAIDIDGTLVSPKEELAPVTREALARAGEAGIQVVLATGRRYGRTLHLIEPLGLRVPLVAAGGALVKDPRDHRTLYRAEFPAAVLEQTLGLIHGLGFEPVVCADTYCQGFEFYHLRLDVVSPELAEYLRLNSDDGRLWPELIACPPPGVFSGFAMGTREQMLGLQQALPAVAAGPTGDPRAPQPEVPRIHVRGGPGGGDEVVGDPPSCPAMGHRR